MRIRPSSILAALAVSAIPAVHAGDVVTLTWKKTATEAENTKTATIELGVGESIKALWGGVRIPQDSQIQGHVRVRLAVTKEAETSISTLVDSHNFGSGVSLMPFQLAGPAVVRILADDFASTSTATFAVTRVGTVSPPAEVPQEAGSSFDVILEQCSDLVNWTPANPGAYSGTETKRFFRTRIVKK